MARPRKSASKSPARKDVVSDRIPEWKLQAAIAADLDRRIAIGIADNDKWPFAYASALEGMVGMLNPYQSQKAKSEGMKAGEPDLRLYFQAGLACPFARIAFVELKGKNGKLTESQKERIPVLRGLGFIVHIVHATDEGDAVHQVGAIVDLETEAAGKSLALESATWWPKVRNAA